MKSGFNLRFGLPDTTYLVPDFFQLGEELTRYTIIRRHNNLSKTYKFVAHKLILAVDLALVQEAKTEATS